MRETDFIEKNRDKWERYEASLERSDQDPELLNQLYVHTTDDLSISRTFYANRSVRVYLNGLAQRTFLHIYRGRRGQLGKFFTFWTDELPRVVYHHRRYLAAALAIFVLSMLVGILSYRIDPAFAAEILGEDYVAMTETNIADGDPMAVYKQQNEWDMSVSITLHNIFVAVLTFIAGAFFCIGAVIMLVNNGVMVGVFQYFFYARGEYVATELSPAMEWMLRGVSWVTTAGGGGVETLLSAIVHVASGTGTFRESLLTIWVHGALEISSIVIAGGAGMIMGSGLLFPGTLTRLQAFGRTARAGLKILLGTVPLFVIAGFLEGYVTRHTELPQWLRLLFILLCFGFILWYYVIYPRVVASRPVPEEELEERSARRSEERVGTVSLSLGRVRGFGANLSTAFDLLRRGLGQVLLGTATIALVYCLLSFGLGKGASYRYQFVNIFLGDFLNFYELLASWGRDRALSFSLLVAVCIYGCLRLGLWVAYRYSDWSPSSDPRREWRLLGVSGLLALCVAFGPVVSVLLVFLLLPFLMVFAVGGHAVNLSVREAFRLTYTHLSGSYGVFLVTSAVVFPLFFLLDTVVMGIIFSFLDWVVRVDQGNIDAYNVMLQAFIYFFFLALLLVTLTIAIAVALGSTLETRTASGLMARIETIGTKRRLRGMERE